MTRKHFESIASNIKKELSYYAKADGTIETGIIAIVDTVADACAEHNNNFDYPRFLSACGLEDGKYTGEKAWYN